MRRSEQKQPKWVFVVTIFLLTFALTLIGSKVYLEKQTISGNAFAQPVGQPTTPVSSPSPILEDPYCSSPTKILSVPSTYRLAGAMKHTLVFTRLYATPISVLDLGDDMVANTVDDSPLMVVYDSPNATPILESQFNGRYFVWREESSPVTRHSTIKYKDFGLDGRYNTSDDDPITYTVAVSSDRTPITSVGINYGSNLIFWVEQDVSSRKMIGRYCDASLQSDTNGSCKSLNAPRGEISFPLSYVNVGELYGYGSFANPQLVFEGVKNSSTGSDVAFWSVAGGFQTLQQNSVVGSATGFLYAFKDLLSGETYLSAAPSNVRFLVSKVLAERRPAVNSHPTSKGNLLVLYHNFDTIYGDRVFVTHVSTPVDILIPQFSSPMEKYITSDATKDLNFAYLQNSQGTFYSQCYHL